MSLITQCPACSTMFKVVQDQLRVSEGWVRCGQCDEVFDANAYLQSVLHEPGPDPLSMDANQKGALSAAVDSQTGSEPEPDTSLASGSYDWDGVLKDPAPPPPSLPPAPEAVQDSFLEKSPKELWATSGGAQVDAPPQPEDVSLPMHPNEVVLVMPDNAAPVSFMAAQGQVRSQLARGWWAAVGVLLLLALLMQFVRQERDRLAATQPALKPALMAMCALLSCKVNAMRQIESIVIDSSTFSKVQPDVYKLSVTVKNNASVEVARPSLELTLTDSQDQTLIRKVVAPMDWGDNSVVMAPAEELSRTIPLAIAQSQGALPIAGYRVVAFYP